MPQIESRLALVRRARRINRILAETYPDAHCELDFGNPLELLVATILSAQCTDKRVNMVTPVLFAKYRTAADYAAADREELEGIIKTTGFFRAKTNSIMGMAQALCDRYGGEVPGKLKDLVTLPGVGRKTANVVLGNAFGVPGLTVDTHFQRLTRRFGWIDETDPVKIEHEVATLIPKAVRWRTPADAEERMTISSTITDYVLEQGQGVITTDAPGDQRFGPAESIMASASSTRPLLARSAAWRMRTE